MCSPRLSVEVRRQISEVRDFHHAGPRDQTQIVGLCSKCLHLLSPMLTSPQGFQRALLTRTGGKEELASSAGFPPHLCLTLRAAVVSWFPEAAHWPAPHFIQWKVETCSPGTESEPSVVSGYAHLSEKECSRRSVPVLGSPASPHTTYCFLRDMSSIPYQKLPMTPSSS